MKKQMINFNEIKHYQIKIKDWYDYGIFDNKDEAIKLFRKFLSKELRKYDLKKYVSRFWMRDRSSWE